MVVQFGHSRCWIRGKTKKIHAMGTLVGELFYQDWASFDHEVDLVAYCMAPETSSYQSGYNQMHD